MSYFWKVRTKSPEVAFFFLFSFQVLSDQREKTAWEESQLESYEITHSPALGRLSISVCVKPALIFFFFLESITILLFLLKKSCLKDVVKFLDKQQVDSWGHAAWCVVVGMGTPLCPKPWAEC